MGSLQTLSQFCTADDTVGSRAAPVELSVSEDSCRIGERTYAFLPDGSEFLPRGRQLQHPLCEIKGLVNGRGVRCGHEFATGLNLAVGSILSSLREVSGRTSALVRSDLHFRRTEPPHVL